MNIHGPSLGPHSFHLMFHLGVVSVHTLSSTTPHLIFFTVFSLINMLFPPPETFIFKDVADKFPVHFRWDLSTLAGLFIFLFPLFFFSLSNRFLISLPLLFCFHFFFICSSCFHSFSSFHFLICFPSLVFFSSLENPFSKCIVEQIVAQWSRSPIFPSHRLTSAAADRRVLWLCVTSGHISFLLPHACL